MIDYIKKNWFEIATYVLIIAVTAFAIFASGCSAHAPVEDMTRDELRAYIAELEAENAELDSEIAELWDDVAWLEFRVDDEKTVCESEVNRLSDLVLAKTHQVQIFYRTCDSGAIDDAVCSSAGWTR